MKLWSGRFSADTDGLADEFHSSVSFDRRLCRYDITGSIAHARMLGKTDILTQEESAAIIRGLGEILSDIEQGKIVFGPEVEDIHMGIETLLIQRIGDTGKKLHTGRSRNDQVALDTRMYVRDEIAETTQLLKTLMLTLLNIAGRHLHTPMPGYTHLQKAQPVTLAHHFMAYCEMFRRDILRLRDAMKRVNVMPLGSGALAGTPHPLDRDMVAQELGFDGITENSMDAVADRDYVLETVSHLAILMMHLSRLSEEIILWCSSEFGFLELSDAYSTGSSIMPQKKNPDIAELVRGKSARVMGHLMALLAMMKSLPLAYNKDMQEDKPALFDAFDNVKLCLKIYSPMLSTATFLENAIRKAAEGGYTNATDLADYLVGKGMPFRDAHALSGAIVALCIQSGIPLSGLPLDKYREYSPLFGEDLYDEISLETCINKRSLPGGPAPDTVAAHIKRMELFLSKS